MDFGKHLPALGFLVVLMGDRPVTEAKARYYQRLLARDQDEATDIVEAYVNPDGRESVYDTVLLPALYYAKQDRDRGLLNEGDAQFVGQARHARCRQRQGPRAIRRAAQSVWRRWEIVCRRSPTPMGFTR